MIALGKATFVNNAWLPWIWLLARVALSGWEVDDEQLWWKTSEGAPNWPVAGLKEAYVMVGAAGDLAEPAPT